MRKIDFLRRQVRKIEKQEDIYFLDVDCFYKRGDYDAPFAIPMHAVVDGKLQLIGVSIQHSYEHVYDDGEAVICTYSEDIRISFPKKVLDAAA